MPRAEGSIPDDIVDACAALGWLLIRAQTSDTYLVQDDSGIIEPYSARTILAQAANVAPIKPGYSRKGASRAHQLSASQRGAI